MVNLKADRFQSAQSLISDFLQSVHFLPSSPHGLYLNQILSTFPDHPVNQRMKSHYRVSWCLLWLYLAIPDLVWLLQTCVNTYGMIVMDMYEHCIVWLLHTCMNTMLLDCYELVWTPYCLVVRLVWTLYCLLQTCMNTMLYDCFRLIWTPHCMIVTDLCEHHIAWLLWTCMNIKLFDCYWLVWIHIVQLLWTECLCPCQIHMLGPCHQMECG